MILAPNGSLNSLRGLEIIFTISKGYPSINPSTAGVEKTLYYASNSLMPSNDIYLAFLSADITRSYFSTMGQLLRGMLTVDA